MNKLFLMVLLVALQTSSFAFEQKKNFSLIISGGISLGAYEAGYNWALLKYLNHVKQQKKGDNVALNSIAGSSAGAINTVMSAMAWCRSKERADSANLIDNNLFYRMWTEVDFEDLLIDKEFGTTDPQNNTSLFSRQKIEKLSEDIFAELQMPYYEKGCEIPFGFAVTSVTPQTSKIQDIEISNKLFHIPLSLQIDDQNRAEIVDNFALKRDNIIHLSHDGKPPVSRIQKALFASSAFPIAFEQVSLEYFHHGKFKKSLFLDGGVFDNVPLDFARRLSHEKAKDYIFMDPKHLRKTLPPRATRHQSQVSSPINNAIQLLGDIFSASESSILYNTLASEFKDTQKRIQVSSRYFPITGKFLEHFGAFLDKGFRQYDYYVGVYDAIVDSANYLCKERANTVEKRERCARAVRYGIYQMLTKDSPRAKYILNLLSREEFGYPLDQKTYPIQEDLLSIFNAVKTLEDQDMDDFYHFIEALRKDAYEAQNSYLKHTLSYPEEWYRRPLSSVVQRIVTLENENSTNLSKAFASLSAYTTGTFYRTKSGYTYNPLSAPFEEEKLWVKAFPYEVAFAKNIFSIGYENYYYIENDNFLIPEALELKPSLSLAFNEQSKQPHFLRVDLNLNYELKEDMITLGFGPSLYQDIAGSFKKEPGFGGNVYLDFLNIFRVTYTQREEYDAKGSYLYLGINDIPSFIYWISK